MDLAFLLLLRLTPILFSALPYDKIVLIESVRTIDDKNVAPSGLASHSLVIQTPNREMKITAPSKERHELWFSVSLHQTSYPPTFPLLALDMF
jgi:hypothetical protein